MHGFFWKDLKRSFLNIGFACGILLLAALLLRAAVMHRWTEAGAAISF